jgi:hypothetical protein
MLLTIFYHLLLLSDIQDGAWGVLHCIFILISILLFLILIFIISCLYIRYYAVILPGDMS